MERAEKIKEIARRYGYDAQSRQCIEEMAELTQAINKYWRKVLSFSTVPIPQDGYMPMLPIEYDNLIEEIADVQIMLWQMEFLLNADVAPAIDEKLARQLARMEEEK